MSTEIHTAPHDLLIADDGAAIALPDGSTLLVEAAGMLPDGRPGWSFVHVTARGTSAPPSLPTAKPSARPSPPCLSAYSDHWGVHA